MVWNDAVRLLLWRCGHWRGICGILGQSKSGMLRSWRSLWLNRLVRSVRAVRGAICAIRHVVLLVHVRRLVMYRLSSTGAVSKHTLDVVVFITVLVQCELETDSYLLPSHNRISALRTHFRPLRALLSARCKRASSTCGSCSGVFEDADMS